MTDRVLVVDDDPFMCEAVNVILSQAGYDVSVANCGADAIEMIRAAMPSVILLDIRMPGISGLQTLAKLRQLGVSTPILMMTADNSPATLQEVMFLGGSGYVLKPFEADEIVERVGLAIAEAAAPKLPRRSLRNHY
ncbi:response regulator [uncultured Brevundimonas sp.]|uniref:response regulator transcription factor n=1 Tax=uncultured Brevundimonas sp. TaxID=213418 RepID=UPI0030ED1A18|tara:strand:- start:6351 stop:6758 length:408 start_codon:yes stop_codon:yes gene_type:complete